MLEGVPGGRGPWRPTEPPWGSPLGQGSGCVCPSGPPRSGRGAVPTAGGRGDGASPHPSRATSPSCCQGSGLCRAVPARGWMPRGRSPRSAAPSHFLTLLRGFIPGLPFPQEAPTSGSGCAQDAVRLAAQQNLFAESIPAAVGSASGRSRGPWGDGCCPLCPLLSHPHGDVPSPSGRSGQRAAGRHREPPSGIEGSGSGLAQLGKVSVFPS